MYEGGEKQKNEMIEDLTNNQRILQEQLEDADERIHELEKKNIEIDDITGVVIQYRDVLYYLKKNILFFIKKIYILFYLLINIIIYIYINLY